MTAEHSSPKSMLEAQGLSEPYSSSDKSLSGRQAAAEEGLSTPTRRHSSPNLPTLLEAELLIKHHLPGSVEADWAWPRAKEKLPKYTWEKKIPTAAPISHLQPAPKAGSISLV